MIAFLRGKLLEKHPNQVIVDTAGVGYDVVIPISTFSALPDAGAEVALRIHTHVREDALALFGFLTAEEKALFEKLISVSGIGPTLAIKVLSGLATAAIIDAIRGGQVEQLVRIPGVGKKTAERMVLELKDKLEGLGGGSCAGRCFRPGRARVERTSNRTCSRRCSIWVASERRPRPRCEKPRPRSRLRPSSPCSAKRWSWCDNMRENRNRIARAAGRRAPIRSRSASHAIGRFHRPAEAQGKSCHRH